MALPDFTVYSQLPTGAYMKKSDRSGPYAWDGASMVLTGFLDASNNGTAATLTVTAGLVGNSGAKFDLYNTADKTTNYERLRAFFTGNVATITTQNAGTGTARSISLATANGGSIGISPAPSNTNGMTFAYGVSNSSGIQTLFKFAPTIVQSGTAAYTGVDIDVQESTTGSGTKLLLRAAVAGSERFRVDNSGIAYANSFISVTSTGIGWSSGFGTTSDLRLVRDNAYELALRFGSASQTFRVYNTYTDASNYERGIFAWISNDLTIGTERAGTGSGRAVNIRVGGTNRWAFNGSGHLIAYNDNSYDIGASGANRPRNIYVANAALSALFRCTSVPTVAGLPTAASAQAAMMFVSDSSVAASGNFGAIVAGGGANIVPVFSDGTDWRIG